MKERIYTAILETKYDKRFTDFLIKNGIEFEAYDLEVAIACECFIKTDEEALLIEKECESYGVEIVRDKKKKTMIF